MSGSSVFPHRPSLAAAFRQTARAERGRRSAPQHANEPGAQGWASPHEIAEAARLCGIDRLFVLSPLHDEGEGALELAAATSVHADRSVTLCLSPTAGAAPVAGLPSTAKGVSDIVAGRARIGEALHPGRARFSHVIASGGFDPAAADEYARGRVAFVMDALRLTYATTVVAFPVGSLDLLADYADPDSAIVLALPDGGEKLARWVRRELEDGGFGDVLLMRREARLPWV